MFRWKLSIEILFDSFYRGLADGSLKKTPKKKGIQDSKCD